MKETKNISRSRAQESSAAIEKCTLQCAIYSTGVINQWVFQTHCEALLAYVRNNGNIAEEK
jgi:hypothetical protein